jgi:hypothetical protein
MPPTPPKVLAGLGLSLEKFPTHAAVPKRTRLQLSGLRGETLSFQIAYRADRRGMVRVELAGPLAAQVTARRIDLAHCEHPTYGVPKESLESQCPAFIPDPLIPAEQFPAYPDQTRGIWFTLPRAARQPAGRSRLDLRVFFGDLRVADLTVEVNVIPAALPRQQLKVIHWFHNDCLQSHYKFEAWSPEHWRIVEKYLRNAAEHGINTITTPVFTPPLDTAVGTERPTMQLVDVELLGKDKYRFGFTKLEKWIDLCRKCGMTDFEISHLSTQWGAKFAPKVLATVRGKLQRIFGWEDPSDGPRYRAFLMQFLPELVKALRRKNALKCSYLHVSDEPHIEHLPQYRAVREILKQAAPELPVVEALSNIEFYDTGLVDRPCPASTHVQPFLDRKVPHLWTYYCCGQRNGVSNRFHDFHSARNRMLGMQLYKFRYEGFLHWGYNHWYAGLTDTLLDPYSCANGGRVLPPGDGYVVYPGPDGPVDGIRWEVWREGIQDMRALYLLGKLAGKTPSRDVAALLALRPIRNMAEYPRSMNWLLAQREAVNRAIARLVAAK